MKIAIVNTVAANGGDAAILWCLYRLVRKLFGNEAEVVVHDKQPEIAARYYPEFRFYIPPCESARRGLMPAAWRRKFSNARVFLGMALLVLGLERAAGSVLPKRILERVEEYKGADLVISTGGTYLVPQYYMADRLVELLLVARAKRPLVLFTQSMGPFLKLMDRAGVKGILKRSILVLLRDERSLRHVQKLAIPNNKAAVYPDSVFALLDPDTVAGVVSQPFPKGPRLKVAVSVREWTKFTSKTADEGMENYTQALAAVVINLVRHHQAEVVFVSTCQGISEYPYDDSRIAHAIWQQLPEDVRPRVQVDRSFHRPQELMTLYSQCDFLISTRMHAAILSLCAGVPVLPIAYEFKTDELYRQLGMSAWVQNIEEINIDTLSEAIKRFMHEIPYLRASLFNRVAHQAQWARSVESVIRNALPDALRAKLTLGRSRTADEGARAASHVAAAPSYGADH